MYELVSCDDFNQCTTDSCNQLGGCFNQPRSCDDSNLCTVDSCDAQTGCTNDEINCDDGLACTAEACVADTGLCDGGIFPGNCVIDNTCYANDDVNPANECEFCRADGMAGENILDWSDVADERLSYIRAFTFRRLNGAKTPPGRPYLDSIKQKNTLFFNTTDAPDILAFNKLVNPYSIDKLRKQNGWAIVTTHLGKGFYWNNRLDPEFKENMEYLASLPGWFVPASQLLDHLKKELGGSEMSAMERFWMEYSHAIDRIKGRLFDSSFY